MFPVVVCGCFGGGTSFVAKLLRSSGLFMGCDASPLWVRKDHESAAFVAENTRFIRECGGGVGTNEAAVEQAIKALRDGTFAKAAAATTVIGPILDAFWGESERQGPWGWKDPLNSLTFPIWKRIFPAARAVVIRKDWDNQSARSLAGSWFRTKSSAVIREAYMNPWWADDGDRESVHRIKFESLLQDWDTYRELTSFCGIRTVNREVYPRFLSLIGLDAGSPSLEGRSGVVFPR